MGQGRVYACLDYVWVSLGNAMKAKQSKAKHHDASIACLLLYEDYVWVSLGHAMKAKQSKTKHASIACLLLYEDDGFYLDMR